MAQAAVGKDGPVRVYRMVSGVNCGTAVNPNGAAGMIEGAVNFALTTVPTRR